LEVVTMSQDATILDLLLVHSDDRAPVLSEGLPEAAAPEKDGVEKPPPADDF